MKIAIVVQSNTGNTRQLAEAIQSAMADEMLIYSERLRLKRCRLT